MQKQTIVARPVAVSRQEAAEMLGISIDTLKRFIARGELPVTRLGACVRIRVAALEAFAAAHEEKPAQTARRGRGGVDADGVILTTRGRRAAL